jgi:hypothetical protein
MSLEWARLLLREAKASRVILLTIGKYGSSYDSYAVLPNVTFDPYTMGALDASDVMYSARFGFDHYSANRAIVQRSFEHWALGQPLP